MYLKLCKVTKKLLPIQFFFFLSLFKVRQDVGKTLNTFWSETLLNYTDSVSTPYFLHSYAEMKEVELVLFCSIFRLQKNTPDILYLSVVISFYFCFLC